MGKEKNFDQFNYQNNYIKIAYDRVNLTVPKGKKEIIKQAAARANEGEGQSMNEFINEAIEERLKKDPHYTPADFMNLPEE